MLIIAASIFLATSAESAVDFYTDETSWQAAAVFVAGSTQSFDTTSSNVGLAIEVNPAPVTNKFICGFPPMAPCSMTLVPESTGLCQTIILKPDPQSVGLTFSDEPEGGGAFFDALSIGDVNDFENDDFDFHFPDGVFAFGFFLVNNTQDVSEAFTVHDMADAVVATKPGLEIPSSSGDQFLGFVSDELIYRAHFDEDVGGDDLAVADFRLSPDATSDSDGDGRTDCFEAMNGSDPNDDQSFPMPVCGDGIIDGLEECDDGGVSSLDSCDSSCLVEAPWTCAGEPSICSIANAVACTSIISVSGTPIDTSNYADGTISMRGKAGPDLVAPGAGVTLRNVEWTFEPPPEAVLFAYLAGGGAIVTQGANSVLSTVSFSVEAPNTVESSFSQMSIGALEFTIIDPDGFPNGNETAAIEPIIVSLPTSLWTTSLAASNVAFFHGDVTLSATIDIYALDVICESGTSDPGGASFTPSPAPAFATLEVALASSCGDGLIEGLETCDDTDLANGDGCDALCQVEPGWTCAGEPSVCMLIAPAVPGPGSLVILPMLVVGLLILRKGW